MGGNIDPGVMATETIVKGNCLPLRMIPLNTVIFALGMRKRDGAKLCRAAGSCATLLQHEGEYVVCKLASGEVRKFEAGVCATVGVMSNEAHQHMKYGKAGRMRWLGIRPTVRGVAMNANEHPHGGGRGKSKGNKHTRSIPLIEYSNFRCMGLENEGNANEGKDQWMGHSKSSKRTHERAWEAAKRFTRIVLDLDLNQNPFNYLQKNLYKVKRRPLGPPLFLFAVLRQK